MYDAIAADASFWQSLIKIDLEICCSVKAAGCPWCGGQLDRGDYERKPRGVAVAMQPTFAIRHSLCCRSCRRRVLPPSVRFLGRRVYVGAIMLLATLKVVVCGAARQTLARWRSWWTSELPTSTFWLAACAMLMPSVCAARLPGSLLERFEKASGSGAEALVATLRFVQPLTSSVGEYFEGGGWSPGLAQKMDLARRGHDLVGRIRIPTRLTRPRNPKGGRHA